MGLDYKKLLEVCRDNFGSPRREFSWWKRRKLRIDADWDTETDEIDKIFERYWEILEYGDVRWGYIIQANNLLYEYGFAECPAVILYCEGPNPYTSPEILEKVNDGVRELVFSKSKNEKLQNIVDHLENHSSRFFGMEIPISTHHSFRMSTSLIFRHFLPETTLNFPYLPIVVANDDSGVLVTLPYWY